MDELEQKLILLAEETREVKRMQQFLCWIVCIGLLAIIIHLGI